MSRTAPLVIRRQPSLARHRFFSALAATTALSLVSPITPASAAGPLPPDEYGYEVIAGANSEALGVSADGKTVVGTSSNAAFQWTAADGARNVGALSAGSRAVAVNADGSVIVGSSGNQAFRWTAANGGTLEYLGTLDAGNIGNSFANGVSADGSVVVGEAFDGFAYNHAFIWTAADGMQDLGTLATSNAGTSSAKSVNADGTVVVGLANSDTGLDRAFRWTEADGMLDLGTFRLDGSGASEARDVSDDGSVVVGRADAYGNYQAFRWTAAGGMQNLGVIDGNLSFGDAVNADGSVVVGWSEAGGINRGFRWTEETGIISVEDWLRNSGVTIASDFTREATAVNADGSVVVGVTQNNTAFVARGQSGIIDVEQFASSLSSSPSARLGLDQASTTLNGLHGDPMRNRLETGKQYLQITTDGGYDKNDISSGGIVITDLTYAYGFEGGITARIAAGGLYTDQNIETGGGFIQKGLFISPEVTLPVAGSLHATIGGYYGSSSLSIDRGYLNGGAMDYSRGKTDVDSWAARLRLDWLDAFTFGATSLTPYTSLTYAHGRMDAYTETGGGFPVRFDGSSEHATVWRAGLDGVTPLDERVRLLTRGEVAYRFEDKTAGTSGAIIGLSGFDFEGRDTDQLWLRGGIGAEFDAAGGTATLMLNASTQGTDPSLWVKSAWKVAF